MDNPVNMLTLSENISEAVKGHRSIQWRVLEYCFVRGEGSYYNE